MSGGYVMVPAWLIEQKPSANAVSAYVVLGLFSKFNAGTGDYDPCFPRIRTIADRMGVSESTAKRALYELRDLGAIQAITRRTPDGDPTSNEYRVLFGALNPPQVTGEPTPRSPVTYNPEGIYPEEDLTPPPPAGGRTSTSPPQPVENPKAKAAPKAEPVPMTAAQRNWFDQWWAAYPKRVGKLDAQRKWVAAVKAGVPPERLLLSARSYARECVQERREARFVVNPGTWLHQGRWDDYAGAGGSGMGATAGASRSLAEKLEVIRRRYGSAVANMSDDDLRDMLDPSDPDYLGAT